MAYYRAYHSLMLSLDVLRRTLSLVMAKQVKLLSNFVDLIGVLLFTVFCCEPQEMIRIPKVVRYNELRIVVVFVFKFHSKI